MGLPVQKTPAPRPADELAILGDDFPTGHRQSGPPCQAEAFVGGVVTILMEPDAARRCDLARKEDLARRIEDHDIRIGADRQHAFATGQAEGPRRPGAADLDPALQGQTPCVTPKV